MPTKTCSIDECARPSVAHGWCHRHYMRFRAHGDPNRVLRRRHNTIDTFWSRVEKTSGCWFWTGSLDAYGYGRFSLNGKYKKAHALSYELVIGPVPLGLELDHRCRTRHCVNPACLEPVTHAENIRRSEWSPSVNARKTHCKWGHPFDEANTYWWKGNRHCRMCRQMRDVARSAQGSRRAVP